MARSLTGIIGYSTLPRPSASTNQTLQLMNRKRNHASPHSESSSPAKKRKIFNGQTNGHYRTSESRPTETNGTHSNNSKSKDSVRLIDVQRQALPIWSAKNSLINQIRDNDCVIVLGETGSGKTTQIPQFIYEAGLCQEPLMIAVTQPRKVAATSLASRVSTEQDKPLGSLVGYSVRFDEKSSKDTRIKYMTDGMLGRELLADPMLSRYGVIIVDEAHERTLRTDLLLTALKGILVQRNSQNSNPSTEIKLEDGLSNKARKRLAKQQATGAKQLAPLKVIVMSATLDAQRFSDFFNGAKILYVKGRQHPVKVLHAAEEQNDYIESALHTFFQIHTEQPPGDVLIFLPGQEDIEALASSIDGLAEKIPTNLLQVLICPMYAALPPSSQAKVFGKAPLNTRKVVLATNIAETSITIPGVRYVIDTGLCKEKRYFPRGNGNGVDALLLQPVSKSSALQRTGRAGREGEGWCFRLYTEKTFSQFREAAIPEIQRCNLTFAVLQMKCLGQNPETADFMDAPSGDAIKSSVIVLFALGALDSKGLTTPIGRRMASFPLDPPQSRSILESVKHPGSTSSLLSVLSLLSTSGKVFIDSKDRDVSTEARLKFRHRSGDHLTLLNALQAYEEVSAGQISMTNGNSKTVEMDFNGKSNMRNRQSGLRDWCKTNFLNERLLKEALDIRKQLRECCEREKIECKAAAKEGDEKQDEGVLKALLSGLWQNTALLTPDGTYRQVIGQERVKIHPSSSLFGKKCPAIMYDELVFTSNTYAMGVSSIPQAWLVDVPFFAQQRQALRGYQTPTNR